MSEAKRLCNPAAENGDDPGALGQPDHLVGYIIQQTIPPFRRIMGQQVTNEFGTITVELVRPEVLFVPSAKSLTAPPSPLAPPQIDHFECYRVEGARQHATGIHLVDEFGTLTIDLKKPYRPCVPVDLRGGAFSTRPSICSATRPSSPPEPRSSTDRACRCSSTTSSRPPPSM